MFYGHFMFHVCIMALCVLHFALQDVKILTVVSATVIKSICPFWRYKHKTAALKCVTLLLLTFYQSSSIEYNIITVKNKLIFIPSGQQNEYTLLITVVY